MMASRLLSSSSLQPSHSTPSSTCSSSIRTRSSSSLSNLVLLSLIPSLVLCASSDHKQPPSIDWSALGNVAILGSFSTLSFYDPSASFSSPFDRSAYLFSHSLQSQHTLPQLIASSDSDGSIYSICASPSKKIYIGGRFDSLNSTLSTFNIAVYDPKSNSISALSNSSSIRGTVYAISCSDESQIWIAGQFENPVSKDQVPNIVSWSSSSGFRSPSNFNLPNFNGPIYSLDQISTPTGQSLIIGGQFTIPIRTDNRTVISNSAHQAFDPSVLGDPNTSNAVSNRPLTLGSSFAPIPLSDRAQWSGSPPSSNPAYQSPANIFCPAGPDGPGNSWELDRSASAGLLTLHLGTSVPVGGIRLANSFVNGGGTAGFHIVSLPNNQILNLAFINPITNQLDTCSLNCTLSRDLSIPYQDYLFPPNTFLEGVQLVISSKFGNVAGLHLLQLLSQGNTAYAVNQLNDGLACQTGIGVGPSLNSATTTGIWNSVDVNTPIPGTVQPVLVASVPPGTQVENAPTLTWSISVPQSGNYELVLQTPGCAQMNDCSARPTLAAIVSISDGPPITTTIDTRNPNDMSSTLYNGTLMDAASGAPDLTVTLRLADSVSGSSSVQMVANQLVLRSTSVASHIPGVLSNGVYELVLAGKGAFGDGSVLNSTTRQASEAFTSVDQLGSHLRLGSAVRSAIADNRTIFVAGDRLSVLNGSSSIATTSASVPNRGLNGAVHALATLDGVVYAGGNFTATADSVVQGLDGLARWKYGQSSSSWEPFSQSGSGVGRPIQAIQIINGLIYVFGRSNNGGDRALGIFNPQNSTWLQSNVGVYFGQLTAATAQTGDDPVLYLAGNLHGIGAAEAPSGALLSTGSGNIPSLTGLNFQINQTASQAQALSLRTQTQTLPSSSLNKPSGLSRRNGIFPRTTVGRRFLQRRQQSVVPGSSMSSINSNLNISLPYALSGTNSPAILTGAFSKNRELIVGGRFVSANSVSNIGIYDLSQSTLKPLNGTTELDGAVLSIKVVNDVAWIGGLFVSPSGKAGLDTYNLTSGQWATEMMAGVVPYSADGNVSVRTIKSRATGDVIVGGRFQQVGSLSCPSICMWSGPSKQWLNLGNGLMGVVNEIEIFGRSQQEIVAVGRFELNQTFNDAAIAKWTLDAHNPSWIPIGSQDRIPGTIRTIALGELVQGEADGMFIAGERSGGGSFLMNWKDNDWVMVDGLDNQASEIDDIAFVPIKDPSTTISTLNGVKSDRLLLASGRIVLSGTATRAGGALYDGQKWYPYFTPIDYNGRAGVLSRMVSSSDGFRSAMRHIQSVIAVIFISMAIAFAIVLIGSLIGFLIGYRRRRKEKNSMAPMDTALGAGAAGLGEDEDEDEEGIHGSRRSSRLVESRRARRPASLLATIDAATAAMAERMQPSQNGLAIDEDDEKHALPSHQETVGTVDEKNLVDAHGLVSDDDHQPPLNPMVNTFGQVVDDGFDDECDVRRARWSFDPQLPGEIAVAAGESVEVKDRSNQEWWLVRRADGIEGVVPADWFL